MNIKIKNKEILFKYKLKRGENYKVSKRKNIWSLTIFKKPQWVRGITSACEFENKDCLFLDYDGVCNWVCEKEIEELAKTYSPFLMFKTREELIEGELVGHYHFISLQKFYPNEILEIQRKTSCDGAYQTMGLRNRYRIWVLRVSNKKGSNKPKFVKVIGNSNLDKEISEAHLKVLQKLYKLPKIDYKAKDGSSKIYYNVYETG